MNPYNVNGRAIMQKGKNNMLKLSMKGTDEKNIFLAMEGTKIFFSSTALTLNSKPVTGLTTKNCQLISGRGSFSYRAKKMGQAYLF
ncbi:MAG: hypothetical protein QM642_08300 [Edaphocola sp.]